MHGRRRPRERHVSFAVQTLPTPSVIGPCDRRRRSQDEHAISSSKLPAVTVSRTDANRGYPKKPSGMATCGGHAAPGVHGGRAGVRPSGMRRWPDVPHALSRWGVGGSTTSQQPLGRPADTGTGAERPPPPTLLLRSQFTNAKPHVRANCSGCPTFFLVAASAAGVRIWPAIRCLADVGVPPRHRRAGPAGL
jgi:hypothetical protein